MDERRDAWIAEARRVPQGSAVESVNEKGVAATKRFGQRNNLLGEIDGLLIDRKILEHEGHAAAQDLSKGTDEQETAVERQAFSPDHLLLAPLLYFSRSEKWSQRDTNRTLLGRH